MASLEDEYYFIRRPDDDGLPLLRPDTDTYRRRYRNIPQPGTKPYFFENALAEEQDLQNIPCPITPPDVLVGGADIIVKSHIRERLLDIEIPNLFMFPSVYIHNDDEWYEDYWYLGFIKEFDVLDRNLSEYVSDGDNDDSVAVLKYVFDADAMRKMTPKDRLLFKIGGTSFGWITCNQSLFPLFYGAGESGVWVQKVSEF